MPNFFKKETPKRNIGRGFIGNRQRKADEAEAMRDYDAELYRLRDEYEKAAKEKDEASFAFFDLFRDARKEGYTHPTAEVLEAARSKAEEMAKKQDEAERAWLSFSMPEILMRKKEEKK